MEIHMKNNNNTMVVNEIEQIWKKEEWVKIGHSESELDGAQGDDKNAENNGNGTITKDLGRGGHHTGLPRPHPVPASRMEEWLPEIPPLLSLVSETHFKFFLKPTAYTQRKKNTDNGKNGGQTSMGVSATRANSKIMQKGCEFVCVDSSVMTENFVDVVWDL